MVGAIGADNSLPLDGRSIVITRPLEQAHALARLLQARGARAIVFPLIDIVELSDRAALDAVVDRLDTFHIGIFVSPNAVKKAMSAIMGRRTLPPHLQIVAVGGGSARELHRHGVVSVTVPDQAFDSEGLLDLPELQAVAGKRIVIFRGERGRELLGDTLVARGAYVEYAACYRRVRSSAPVTPLLEAWARDDIDGIVITSSEGLRNLHEMLDEAGRAALAKTRIFVPHSRIASAARALGLDSVEVTRVGDEEIAASIAEHFHR